MIELRRSGCKRVTAAVVAAAILAWAGASDAAPRRGAKPACDRAQFRVAVDVGHSAESPGAFSSRGIPEYDFNLRLGQHIEDVLRAAGFSKAMLMVTDGPAIPSLFKRVADANAMEAQLFLSIHHDSVPESFLKLWDYEGAEYRFSDEFKGHSVFVSYDNKNRTDSLRFGRLLGYHLKLRDLQYTPHYTLAAMGKRRRQLVDAETGVYRYDKLMVLRGTRMPAVLLEAGSIINRDEEVLASSPERTALVALAVTAAVDDFCAGRALPPAERPGLMRPAAAATPRVPR